MPCPSLVSNAGAQLTGSWSTVPPHPVSTIQDYCGNAFLMMLEACDTHDTAGCPGWSGGQRHKEIRSQRKICVPPFLNPAHAGIRAEQSSPDNFVTGPGSGQASHIIQV